jgi:ArsR family transcriptional regulator
MHRKKFDSILKSVASLFRTLSHPDRLRLIGLLQDGEKDVTQLHRAMEVSQSVVSQHLKLFKLQGLVNERKEANHVFYSLRTPLVRQIIATAIVMQNQDFTQQGQETLALREEMLGLWQNETP